jgi:hypothetical protein
MESQVGLPKFCARGQDAIQGLISTRRRGADSSEFRDLDPNDNVVDSSSVVMANELAGPQP